MNQKIVMEIMDILTSLDNRIIELEHPEKNKYFNNGEREKINRIKDYIRRMPK